MRVQEGAKEEERPDLKVIPEKTKDRSWNHVVSGVVVGVLLSLTKHDTMVSRGARIHDSSEYEISSPGFSLDPPPDCRSSIPSYTRRAQILGNPLIPVLLLLSTRLLCRGIRMTHADG